jgi:hypothetical protein
MAALDVESGLIVGGCVTISSEQNALVPMLQDIQETFGVLPEGALADGVYATGENLTALDEMGVELLSPLPGPDIEAKNPAVREDPTKPVPEEDRADLPINAQTKKLDKSCFIYNEQEDRYYCPEGRVLEYQETKSELRGGQRITRRVYRSGNCTGCPLMSLCLKDGNQHGRSVHRDVYEKRRRQHAEKMATAEAKERYKKRFHAAEVPFAILKHILDMRRFLLRGHRKVQIEWAWSCTVYNLKKILAAMARVRAESGVPAAADAA